jgi:hypothetical protein
MSSVSTSPIAPPARVASLTPDLADRATQTFVDGVLRAMDSLSGGKP